MLNVSFAEFSIQILMASARAKVVLVIRAPRCNGELLQDCVEVFGENVC